MYCTRIEGECPAVEKDDSCVFVLMPFEGFNSIFDAIKQAIESVPGKRYHCDRADLKYTNKSVWCERICSNIRKAKFCIADTTGKNPNVFYELGFAHSYGKTKTIVITQNILDAPFDIRDLGHIVYSEKELPKLREELREAIIGLDYNLDIDIAANGNVDQQFIEIVTIAMEIEKGISDEFIKKSIETIKRRIAKL